MNTLELGLNNIQLPEFSLEVPEDNEVVKLVDSFDTNRRNLLERAEEFGLNQQQLLSQNANSIIVGPFIYPTPLPATVAGNPENLRTATTIGNKFSDELLNRGYIPEQYSMLTLAMSTIPLKSSKDCLILPKNADQNQKVPMFEKSEVGKAYAFAQMSKADYQRIRAAISNSFITYKDRTEEMRKVGKAKGRDVLTAALADFETAWQTLAINVDTAIPYLDFSREYNLQIAERTIPGFRLPTTAIDTAVYSPFLKGIADIETFITKMTEAGVINQNQNVFKVVDPRGRTEMFQVAEIIASDLILRSSLSGMTIKFSEFVEEDVDIAPCKELSYVMCFSNMLPVIYGDINNDPYYEPYAKARWQIKGLGFDPVLYRMQSLIPQDVRQIPTLFDYYKDLVIGGAM